MHPGRKYFRQEPLQQTDKISWLNKSSSRGEAQNGTKNLQQRDKMSFSKHGPESLQQQMVRPQSLVLPGVGVGLGLLTAASLAMEIKALHIEIRISADINSLQRLQLAPYMHDGASPPLKHAELNLEIEKHKKRASRWRRTSRALAVLALGCGAVGFTTYLVARKV